MRTISRLLLLSASLVVAGPIASWADSPYKINYDFHEPNDLKAYPNPGPGPAVDGEGDQLPALNPGRAEGIEPGRQLDPALLNDPSVVKWPTLDASLWEKYKGQYKIVPR